MFERYTEKARRVVFFARFEASQYGSPYIETEHFLLGLLREDSNVAKLLPKMKSLDEIRLEIEQHIERRERISTSVEVPLSAECKRILNAAAEEAERLGHYHVGTEHLLLGIFREKKCFAATILRADELSLAKLREKLRGSRSKSYTAASVEPPDSIDIQEALDRFLAALRDGTLKERLNFFAPDCSFVDASGKLWHGRDEISQNLETLFAPFAKRSAKPCPATHSCSGEFLWVSTLTWMNVYLVGFSPLDLFRMSIVFGSGEADPVVCLIQMTPLRREAFGKTAAT
jgi:hypothetical protein